MSDTISEKRIQAARANGAKSRGPVTPQGKANSSRNAIRHGLLAASVLVGEECRTNFKSVLDLLIQRFQPADGVELAMIEELAASTWRLRRVWAMESEMLAGAMQDQDAPNEITRMTAAFAGLATRPEIHLLHRYETRLHMMYQRSLHNLRTMRQADMRNEPGNSLISEGDAGTEPTESGPNEPGEPNEPVFLPPGPIDAPPAARPEPYESPLPSLLPHPAPSANNNTARPSSALPQRLGSSAANEAETIQATPEPENETDMMYRHSLHSLRTTPGPIDAPPAARPEPHEPPLRSLLPHAAPSANNATARPFSALPQRLGGSAVSEAETIQPTPESENEPDMMYQRSLPPHDGKAEEILPHRPAVLARFCHTGSVTPKRCHPTGVARLHSRRGGKPNTG